MDLLDIRNLTTEYQNALDDEFKVKAILNLQHDYIAELEAETLRDAYEDGTINGKNAETRKRQEAALLAEIDEVQEAKSVARNNEAAAAFAEHERKAQEAYLGLVKAWLYSQARIG
jgi:hypothetical protein